MKFPTQHTMTLHYIAYQRGSHSHVINTLHFGLGAGQGLDLPHTSYNPAHHLFFFSKTNIMYLVSFLYDKIRNKQYDLIQVLKKLHLEISFVKFLTIFISSLITPARQCYETSVFKKKMLSVHIGLTGS